MQRQNRCLSESIASFFLKLASSPGIVIEMVKPPNPNPTFLEGRNRITLAMEAAQGLLIGALSNNTIGDLADEQIGSPKAAIHAGCDLEDANIYVRLGLTIASECPSDLSV